MLNMYYGAEEVAELLRISKGKSYAIIRDLNKELEQKGFITIAGKVPRKYLEERCYGIAFFQISRGALSASFIFSPTISMAS